MKQLLISLSLVTVMLGGCTYPVEKVYVQNEPLYTTMWEWNGVDDSQFDTAYEWSAGAGDLTVEAGPLGPYLVLNKTAQTTKGWVTFTINDFDWADVAAAGADRIRINIVLGPRAGGGTVYGDNVVPILTPIFIDNTHHFSMLRNNTYLNKMHFEIFNGVNAGAVYGPNLEIALNNDYGGRITADITYKQPTSTTDPDFTYDVESWMNAVTTHTRNHATNSGHSNNWGGHSPAVYGWDAGWQTDDPSKIAISFYGEGLPAGKSFVSQFSIEADL